MTTISLRELPLTTATALKRAIANGQEVFITDDQEEPLARVISLSNATDQLSDTPLRQGGFAKGKIVLPDGWDSLEANNEVARDFGMLDK